MLMNTSPAPNRGRKLYLDALRIIAIFGVLFNHTNTKGFALFTIATESVFFPVYLFCAVACKVAVPVFLMISGALLLKKEEPVPVIIKKRFVKFLVILLLTALIIHLYFLNWNLAKFSLRTFLKQVYSINITSSLWYLYAYLAYILTLPFLRRLAGAMQPKDYLYLTGLMVLVSVLRTFELLALDYQIQYNTNFDLFTTANIVYYPLMGHFLSNELRDEKITAKTAFLAGAVGFFFLIVNCWLTCAWCSHLGEWEYTTCQKFMHRFNFFPAIALFILIRFVFMRIDLNQTLQKAIMYLGSCTFGIYLFERIYREETLFVFDLLAPYLPRFLACMIWVFAAFLFGLVVTAILKKIPVIKKYI